MDRYKPSSFSSRRATSSSERARFFLVVVCGGGGSPSPGVRGFEGASDDGGALNGLPSLPMPRVLGPPSTACLGDSCLTPGSGPL